MKFFWILTLALFLSGCLAPKPEPPVSTRLQNQMLVEDTEWQGRIIIDGSVTVAKGATLNIRPGTEILFLPGDRDEDGLGDGTLVIKGELIALGTREEPIVFRSSSDQPEVAGWLEIRADFARQLQLRHCEIRDSAYTVHAHFTQGFIENSWIHHNIDGCRLGRSKITIRNSLIERNQGKGVNFRDSDIVIKDNIIRYNGSGIFLFEKSRSSRIFGNNLYGNQYNLRLGDFYMDDVAVEGNWWGSDDSASIASSIYDRKVDPEIGEVKTSPLRDWNPQAGPVESVSLTKSWRIETGGFIDSSPLIDAGQVFFGSWDGKVYALTSAGRLQWSVDAGDVIDGGLAVSGSTLYLQTWQRQVHALKRTNGQLLWSFEYPESPADDHRQGGVVLAGKLLLVPAWNGTLYALDAGTGELVWQYQAGLPLRSAPLVIEQTIFVASGSGELLALDLEGRLVWRKQLAAPLLSSPAALGAGLVVVSKAGVITALDLKGDPLWQTDLQQTCFYGAPVVVDQSLYLGTAGNTIWHLDGDTGRPLWRFATVGAVYATPRISGRLLYLGDNAGTLYVLNRLSGQLLASYETGQAIQSTPGLNDNHLLFGGRDQILHSLQIDPPAPLTTRP